jgi:zinc transporter, ZIP family
MVWIAAGAMLAVILLDVFPEAYQQIGPVGLFAAAGSGYLLLWTVSRTVFHVCPSCAIAELGDGSELGVGRGVLLMMIALGIHSALDGIGLVSASTLVGRGDLGLMFGISLHKFPEGLALALLLVGAGMSRLKAFLYSLLVEAFTAIGGIIGLLALPHIKAAYVTAVTAHVAGGFLFLIVSAAGAAQWKAHSGSRTALVLCGSISFLVTAIFLVLVGVG